MVLSPETKVMSLSGMSSIADQSEQLDVSLRTDMKEVKINSKVRKFDAVFYSKQTCNLLDMDSYLLEFSKTGNGKAYLTPVSSSHTLTFLDDTNKINNNKFVDMQNMIVQDAFKMPHPGRNKHDQLSIEMKNYLFQPVKLIKSPEKVSIFMQDIYDSRAQGKKKPSILNPSGSATSKSELLKTKSNDSSSIDMLNCQHWLLNRINLIDIKKLEAVDFQIEVFMRKSQAMSFIELLEFLDVEPAKLLNVLQQVCYLVRGNWVIKSNLLYKVDALRDTETRQAHHKDLIVAREHLLWLLASGKKIQFDQIYKKYNVSYFQ